MKSFFLFLVCACLPSLADTRILPHVTASEGTFETTLYLGNLTQQSLSYHLYGTDGNGVVVTETTGSLSPGQTNVKTVAELFERQDFAYISSDAPSGFLMSAAYRAKVEGAGPAHVDSTATSSRFWRLYAGNTQVTWDGIAVVNAGDHATSVTVRQVDAAGHLLASRVLATELGQGAKLLLNLNALFVGGEGSYYEISSDMPLYVLALRGSQDGTLLWQNPTIALQGQDLSAVSWTTEAAFPKLYFPGLVQVEVAPDDSSRMFALQRDGHIQAFVNDRNTDVQTTALDLSDRVGSTGEMGLLGMAFHPNYANNGYIYVNYTVGTVAFRTFISRFTRNAENPNLFDLESEVVVLEFEQPTDIHNGGQLAFGPDGYLYVAVGDGGSGGDPLNNAQNLGNLLGSILRIDVNPSDNGKTYDIPHDNPFVDNAAGWREEIWAYGLRNPWRFSFDHYDGQTRLWAGDVGQGRIEEVNLIEPGLNYGWRLVEGDLCYNPSLECPTENIQMPFFQYDHSAGDRSITGGLVYRGDQEPLLFGRYVYADFISGRIWSLNTSPGLADNVLLTKMSGNPVSLSRGAQGEIYICHYGGAILKLVSTPHP